MRAGATDESMSAAATPGTGISAQATIRRAVEGDLPALLEMLAALSVETGYGDSFCSEIEALRRYGFGPRPLFRTLIAENAVTSLGMGLYFPEFSTQRGLPGVYLQDIYLRPEARASGLGRRLLGAIVRDAGDWDAAYLRLAVHADNEGARAFYGRLGFLRDPQELPLWIEGPSLAKLGAIE